jgi:hypothetical protein
MKYKIIITFFSKTLKLPLFRRRTEDSAQANEEDLMKSRMLANTSLKP